MACILVLPMTADRASPSLDTSRRFLPEALAGVGLLRGLDGDDRRSLDRVRGISYLHLFDALEGLLFDAARRRESDGAVLAPLLRPGAFDHHELFRGLEADLAAAFEPAPLLVAGMPELERALDASTPLALLVLALHLKLVTQQHYLACVRGNERLEPRFVGALRRHWTIECGTEATADSTLALQGALSDAGPGQVSRALRDYRKLVFTCDDVLARQAELDVTSVERSRGAKLAPDAHREAVAAEHAAHRKTFLTVGIVNAAFIYVMRSLGPTAPAILAGIVAALGARGVLPPSP